MSYVILLNQLFQALPSCCLVLRCWRHQLEGRDPLGTMIIQIRSRPLNRIQATCRSGREKLSPGAGPALHLARNRRTVANNRLAAPAGYHHNALSQYHLGVKLIAAPVFGPIKATSSKRSTLLDHSGSDAGQALQQHLAALAQ